MGKHRKGPFRVARQCDCGDHGFVGLTKGFVALLDADSVADVAKWNWNASTGNGKVYARRANGGKGYLMHRLMCKVSKRDVVDHISGDTLDNRSSNLRVCSHNENLWNSRAHGATASKGVSQDTKTGRFFASICFNGKRLNLGSYETEREAAIAYYAASKVAQGEFRNKASAPEWVAEPAQRIGGQQ